MKTMIEYMHSELSARKDRSAWCKGVTGYALEILEEVKNRIAWEGHEPENREQLIDYMLNGAKEWRTPNNLLNHWKVASWDGNYEICDCEVAKRLCTPSELKRCKGGELNPNGREQWLDVQARALFQAGNRLLSLFRQYKELSL